MSTPDDVATWGEGRRGGLIDRHCPRSRLMLSAGKWQ